MSSLGLVETKSIAIGIGLADEMVKRAGVELLRAKTICSGRFMILVSGDRSAVGEAMLEAEEVGEIVSSKYLISRVSQQVVGILSKTPQDVAYGALGIIECRNVIMGISGADAAVKASAVSLVKLICGQGINGKSYFILNGDVADVEAGIGAAVEVIGKSLLYKKIIPSPDSAILQKVL